jgi:hypothetical protein
MLAAMNRSAASWRRGGALLSGVLCALIVCAGASAESNAATSASTGASTTAGTAAATGAVQMLGFSASGAAAEAAGSSSASTPICRRRNCAPGWSRWPLSRITSARRMTRPMRNFS